MMDNVSNLNKKVAFGIATASALGFYMYWSSSKKYKDYHSVGVLSKLYLYPVKSCGALQVDEGQVTSRGLKSNGIYDRSFMIIDDNGQYVTARAYPRMVHITPGFSSDGKSLILNAPNKPEIRISLQQNGRVTNTKVKVTPVSGYDCGDDVAKWISDYLDKPCRLIFYGENLPSKELRKVAPIGHNMRIDEKGLYQDTGHFHLLSEASLEDLNSRLEEPIIEKNFRPNFYVKDCSPFAEDFWKYVKIGEEAEIRFTHFCGRCKMTTLNIKEGAYISQEPLKIMKEYRQCYDFSPDCKIYASKPIFGTNLNMEREGIVHVGDPVYATIQYQEHASG